MRLEKDEIASIRSVIKLLDSKAKIFLYGSRVDDSKRGGDIDLLVVSESISV